MLNTTKAVKMLKCKSQRIKKQKSWCKKKKVAIK